MVHIVLLNIFKVISFCKKVIKNNQTKFKYVFSLEKKRKMSSINLNFFHRYYRNLIPLYTKVQKLYK